MTKAMKNYTAFGVSAVAAAGLPALADTDAYYSVEVSGSISSDPLDQTPFFVDLDSVGTDGYGLRFEYGRDLKVPKWGFTNFTVRATHTQLEFSSYGESNNLPVPVTKYQSDTSNLDVTTLDFMAGRDYDLGGGGSMKISLGLRAGRLSAADSYAKYEDDGTLEQSNTQNFDGRGFGPSVSFETTAPLSNGFFATLDAGASRLFMSGDFSQTFEPVRPPATNSSDRGQIDMLEFSIGVGKAINENSSWELGIRRSTIKGADTVGSGIVSVPANSNSIDNDQVYLKFSRNF